MQDLKRGKIDQEQYRIAIKKRSAPCLNEIPSNHSPSSIAEASKAEESTNDQKSSSLQILTTHNIKDRTTGKKKILRRKN